jgi:predicted phosphodiesterase
MQPHPGNSNVKLSNPELIEQQAAPTRSIRLHVLSDLHFEFQKMGINQVEADVVVLAGDIDVGRKGLDWIHRCFNDRPVIYVLGNHEYYRHALPELTEQLRQETAGSNIHLLENDAVELFGFRFLGCTLWTDFMAGGDWVTALHAANDLVNDYRVVRNSGQNRRLLAQDTAQLHTRSVAWMETELPKHAPHRTIVVTHHAPSLQSEEPRFRGGALSPSFVSDLDTLVKKSGVPLWVHGHTHFNVDYRLGATRVLSNQRGYPKQTCQGFDSALVVTVGIDAPERTSADEEK